MKIFQRAILLGIFITVGVGIALGLGFSTDTSSSVKNNDLCLNRDANIPAKHSAAQTDSGRSSSPVVVLPNPPFASQATHSASEQTPAVETAPQAAPVQLAANSTSQEDSVPTESLNTGNLASQSGANFLLKQAAKLLGQVENNDKPQKEKPQAAALEQIPAGAQTPFKATASQNTSGDQLDGVKVIKVNGSERLSINIQNANIREVLDLLGQQGNLNILTSSQVQGTVSATLSDVDLNSALDAILKSTGLTARREGNFIFVGNNQDFENMERSMDRISTRVYRPNYIQAAELESLIKPVLTQGIPGAGEVSATTPSETGIAEDDNDVGGDNYAGADAVVVRDFEAILAEIDQLVLDVDVRPTQVQIEAMILSVELSDDFEFGVSFEVLRQFPHLRFGWGMPQSSLNSVSAEGQVTPFKFDGALDVAFLDESLGAFVKAVEKVGDTDVIGTPRILVLNKHRADIQVGEEQGYVNTTQTETARTQSVEMLKLGTILRIRPFISSDGIIRMEVHPEISDGYVKLDQGLTLPMKQVTQVTTNVMVHDGCTVVIGGLIKEELKIHRTQVPLLGSLPVVGVFFRQKIEIIKRRELIVLLTPHIVKEPGMCEEGNEAASEFHRRQDVVREKTSPIGKRSLGRRYTRKAQQAWAMGDRDRAMRLAEMAVNFDPQNRAAIDLRSNIWMGRRVGKHTLPPESDYPQMQNQPKNPLDDQQLAPWILDDLGKQPTKPGETRQQMTPIPMNAVPMNAVPQHPIDPGQPGRRVIINRPKKLDPLASPRQQ